MTVNCAKCGASICVENLHELQRTRATFYCPSGHRNYFPDGCEHQEALKQVRRDHQRVVDRLLLRIEEASRASKTCPWPGCRTFVYARRDGLYAHMQREHGMPLLAEVRAQDEGAA